MKKNVFFGAVYLLALAVTVVNIAFSVKNYLYPDINDLPSGSIAGSFEAESGRRTVNIYLVETNFGTAVRGELVLETGECKNIFWQTGIKKVNVSWDGDEVVFFNNVPLSGNGENSYDCRRGVSLFTDGALENERLRY